MEVHPPSHPLTTFREALVHVALMTIGLFIALMLEGVVEWVHHKHIVREARENIHREIEENHETALQDVAKLQKNMDLMRSNISSLKAIQSDLKAHTDHKGTLRYAFTFSTLNGSAWTTARDTGALAYMPYTEVQGYSDLYDSQVEMNQRVTEISKAEFHLLGPVMTDREFKDIPAQEFEDMLQGTAAAIIDVCTTKQQLQQLDAAYLKQLGRKQEPVDESCDTKSR